MKVSIKTYISNINDVLANIVLPSVDMGFAKIQLSYAIDMLNQLQNRVEYRHDVIKDDYIAAKAILDLICVALNDNHVDIPKDIIHHIESNSPDGVADTISEDELTRMETASTKVLDLMYENSTQINNFNEIEKNVLSLLRQLTKKKAGLRVPTINLELLES